MRFVDGAVYFPTERVVAIADLHLGYEAELRAKGVDMPSSEHEVLIKRIKTIIHHTNPSRIVLNGDVKHSFGKIHDDDWRHIRDVLEAFGEREISIVTGNHDPLLGPLAEKYSLSLYKELVIGDILFLHGDALPETDLEAISRIVIGHEHPAVGLRLGPRVEVAKCYLRGTWKGKELIVLPSMFSLTAGIDLLAKEPQSPFLTDIDDFEVVVLENGQLFPFSTLGKLKKLSTESL